MATTALGPTMAGGYQPIVESGYALTYYPDTNNDALQREGKPPVFYWLPNTVRLARKNDQPDGDLMFNLMRFAGVQNSDTTVGLAAGEDSREVAGGVLSFTVTAAPPDAVLKESQKKITAMFRGKNDFFWGIRSTQAPVFRPVIILSNTTAVSNLSPQADGSVPVPMPSGGGGGGNGSDPGAGPRSNGNGSHQYEMVAVPPMITQKGFSTKAMGRKRSGSALDPWYWNMQGQGNGSIDPMGKNPYTALVGAYPTALLWAAFHGAYTPVFIQQALKIKFWVPIMEITIKGNWDKIFQHFSAAAKARYLWFSADIKAEFNNMRTSGGITVEVKVDNTIPGSEDIGKYVDQKTNLVFEKFMEQAKKMIFDPPQPTVEAAQASSGSFGIWGAGLALKYRRDSTKLELYYHEKRQMSYLQDTVIGESLEGLFDEIQANPEAEKKYFQTLYLDDWPRKLGRIIKPIVNWPKPELNWAGEPVAFVSVQAGYPNTHGELMWTGRTFQKTDPLDASWSFSMTQKQEAHVENPPAGWTPDTTYIKRAVHFLEPPDPAENPFVRVQIADNQINLDDGPNGTPLNDICLEVRADEAGRIRLGPLSIDVELENARQHVEVTMQATREDGTALEQFSPVKFSWNHETQEIPRFWSVFSADKAIRSFYKYQVRVIVKGSLFTKGMEWISPWKESLGNGPLMISVPTVEDEGVQVIKSYKGRQEAIEESTSSQPPIMAEGEKSSASRNSGSAVQNLIEGIEGVTPGEEQERMIISAPTRKPRDKAASSGSMMPPSSEARSSVKRGSSADSDASLSYWKEEQ